MIHIAICRVTAQVIILVLLIILRQLGEVVVGAEKRVVVEVIEYICCAVAVAVAVVEAVAQLQVSNPRQRLGVACLCAVAPICIGSG